MDNQTYHALPQVSASQLVTLRRSPLHFWDRYINPNKPVIEPTPAMFLGTLAHAAILEPQEFDSRYIVLPDGIDRRTKEGKALYESIVATGKEPVKSDMWLLVQGMLGASLRNNTLQAILCDALTEHTILYSCNETLEACRARPDIYLPACTEYPHGLILDLKTTTDASPDAFGRRAWDGGMLIQAAHYCAGVYAETGEWPAYGWVAIESQRPHALKIYMATPQQMQYGIDERFRLLRIYRECIDSGKWPAYGDDIAELELPVWANREAGIEIDQESVEVKYND